MNTRREELEKLSVKNLIPIAKNLKIKNISRLRKNILVDSILDFERKPYYKRCKPYVCKRIGVAADPNLKETKNFITCSECFSFSLI